MDHPQIAHAMATGYGTKEEVERELANEIEHVEDHPVEDMFGTEVTPSDGYFITPSGQVINSVNVEDYLIEVVGCEAFIAKK